MNPRHHLNSPHKTPTTETNPQGEEPTHAAGSRRHHCLCHRWKLKLPPPDLINAPPKPTATKKVIQVLSAAIYRYCSRPYHAGKSLQCRRNLLCRRRNLLRMDAQLAYGFHHLRNKKPYLAQGPVSNKLIYSSYSCIQGWFFTPCTTDPGLRGLNNILRLHVKRLNSTEWEPVTIPSSVRSIVALNLHSFASGRNPWGNLKPEYLEKKGFVEAKPDDGLLEIFGFKHGWQKLKLI